MSKGTTVTDPILTEDHSARHEDAGADEVSIQGLSGTPAALTTHEAAADPHTGYRLESADHSHQSTGGAAGKLDHGLALDGLTDDDHTQYRLETADHTHQSTGLQAGLIDQGRSVKVGLVVKVNATNPTYQVDIDADYLGIEEYVKATINLTADITASGANGLDTGSEAASTWYSIWAIYNPTTDTVASLLSTSATAPSMPSGYTKKRRVGWVRNNASSNFEVFHHDSNLVLRDSFVQVLAAGVSETWVDVDCAAVIPPSAKTGFFGGRATIDSGTGYEWAVIRKNGSAGDGLVVSAIQGSTWSRNWGSLFCPVDTSQIIEYKVSANCELELQLNGYIDEV